MGVSKGEEFEAVAEAVAIAHDGADFQWVGAEGQGNFEGDDFAFLEFSGESGADAILTEFGGVSPAGAKFAGLEWEARLGKQGVSWQDSLRPR